MIHSVEFNLAL